MKDIYIWIRYSGNSSSEKIFDNIINVVSCYILSRYVASTIMYFLAIFLCKHITTIYYLTDLRPQCNSYKNTYQWQHGKLHIQSYVFIILCIIHYYITNFFFLYVLFFSDTRCLPDEHCFQESDSHEIITTR